MHSRSYKNFSGNIPYDTSQGGEGWKLVLHHPIHILHGGLLHSYIHIHKYIHPYVYGRRQVTCFCCAAFETKFLSTDSFSAATETSKYPKFVIFILSMYLSLCLATVDSHWNSSVATLATWWKILVTASGKCCC